MAFSEEIFIKTFCYGRQRTFEKIPIGEDVRLKPKKCESWFKGRNVTVAVFGFLPFFTFLPDGSVGGGEADVIQILAQHYGFHVNFEFEAAGGAEKVIDENGNEKWIGIVGKVQNGSAQLGAGVLFMDFEYSNAVDFNGVLHQVMVKIMSPKAKPLKPYFNLLRPFPLRVWIPIFAVLFLTIVVYPILTKPFSQDPNAIRDGLIIYGLTFYQSYRVSVPDKWAPRLFLLANFFYLFFLFSSYECNLRAYLMSVDYEPVVNSEKDLLTMNKEIFLPVSTSFISMYQFSTLEIRQKIWNKVETNNLFYHPFEEFMTKTFEEKIIQRQASFLMSPEMALVSFPEFEKRHGYQPFHMSKEAITPFYTTFVSPKNKPWHEDTTHLVQRLFEAGITKTLIMNYVKPRSLLRDVQESNPEPFNLEHFLAAFISLGAGLMLSSLAFIMEIWCPPRILHQPSSS
ncbi:glutamate receptor ionotropic, delta-2-like [Tigriopus californicus]|uniref:glutamate receptor ionotropic, delta-2-like n=1 Tax=Tigriopus californicus TaxID=6832 RepID=UPI0027DA4C55|nr:glutamate receptor ionotropic, delta-2-like [Tigriopus californicus]